MRNQLEALRSDYTNPPSPRVIEYIDDQILESEMNLQLRVSQSLWSLYTRYGEEGVRNQRTARELEEVENLERRCVPVMRRTMYVQAAAFIEFERQEVNQLAAMGNVLEIQARINRTQDIIAEGVHGEDLVDREGTRVNVEAAHECLQTLRAALTIVEAANSVEAERQRAAVRRREVERLEAQLELREPALEQSRVMAEQPFRCLRSLHLYLLENRRMTLDEIATLRALGLGDPSEHDTEPGEV
ncbi:MAG: hypothetical protein LQ347_005326 [Umbilicaria vellea]|nr:MAG: hypothetical protein LQ347_005326 [Umbilicaria vellea]